MASPQFPNHLRANRKRLALSQEDVAFLLGSESGAKVCRYERFVREPSLETILAYEAIFQKPASALFPALFRKIRAAVVTRAKILARRAARLKPNRQTARKRQTLTSIAASPSNKSLKP